ncbi:MAG: hypothetical protein NWF07_07830 [Candidatus Bathyarchaeota archaeon]|nr:hypothetical protein [Candidatus Bathyarchaeota archaeon]
MSLIFQTKSVTVDEQTLYGSMGMLENAIIVFFWVGEKPKLGSLTATLPDKSGSQLLGDRDEVVSRVIGDKVASKYDRIALVSTNLPLGFEVREVLRLLNELMSE